MIDLKGSWDNHLPLIEFAYNNSYIHAFRWPLKMLYMGVDVDLLLVGLK